MHILRILTRRHEFRARVSREACDLLTWMGEAAYGEARQRMREARRRGDRQGQQLWSAVAIEIADRIGHEIGRKGAARWPDPPPRPDSRRREIADRLIEISRGIGALSAGRADATTVHNIGAAARQILDFVGRTPALEQAAADVIVACEAIVIAPTESELARGVYPPAVEDAGRALQRLRALVLPTS